MPPIASASRRCHQANRAESLLARHQCRRRMFRRQAETKLSLILALSAAARLDSAGCRKRETPCSQPIFSNEPRRSSATVAARGLMLVTAESCTGGLVAALLTCDRRFVRCVRTWLRHLFEPRQARLSRSRCGASRDIRRGERRNRPRHGRRRAWRMRKRRSPWPSPASRAPAAAPPQSPSASSISAADRAVPSRLSSGASAISAGPRCGSRLSLWRSIFSAKPSISAWPSCEIGRPADKNMRQH